MPYDIIYADPCWTYTNKKTGGSHTSGAAQQYPVMSTYDIAQLPIPTIASRNAVLFLWATTPLGKDPFDVMSAWGFRYKTKAYWHKAGRKGTGYWLRGCVEELLIGVRGSVKAWRSNIDNWQPGDPIEIIESKPDGHSRKPEAAIRLIEQLTPGAGPRIELFATEHSRELASRTLVVPGWECYGLDLGHDFREPAFWEALRTGVPIGTTTTAAR